MKTGVLLRSYQKNEHRGIMRIHAFYRGGTLALLIAMMLCGCEAGGEPGRSAVRAAVNVISCPERPCDAEGLCTLTGRGCVAGGNADCRQSWACMDEGRCDAVGGECVDAAGL